jgi:hypothetical protein
MTDDYLNKLTEKIIGIAIEVHRELGPGLLEIDAKADRAINQLQFNFIEKRY